jgi:hypothetical protein
MPIAKSSLSSMILVAWTHFPLFCRLVKQPDVIATKFIVSPMAITYVPLQCIIITSLMNASFRYHVTMKDTHHLAELQNYRTTELQNCLLQNDRTIERQNDKRQNQNGCKMEGNRYIMGLPFCRSVVL